MNFAQPLGDNVRAGEYLIGHVPSTGTSRVLYSIFVTVSTRIAPDPGNYWVFEFGEIRSEQFIPRGAISFAKTGLPKKTSFYDLPRPIEFRPGEIVAVKLVEYGDAAAPQGLSVLPVFEFRGV